MNGTLTKKTVNYSVKSGDSLISIAHHFGLKGIQLKHFNELTNDTLHIGQTLKIPT